MKNHCEICDTTDKVHKVKYLPFPLGRKGHVTLTEPSYYCVNCMISEGEKYSDMMDKKYLEMGVIAHE